MEKYFTYIQACLKSDKLDNNSYQAIYTSYIKAMDFYELLLENDKIIIADLFEKYLNNIDNIDNIVDSMNNLYINMVYFSTVGCYEMINEYIV